jgi:hypothetical protein
MVVFVVFTRIDRLIGFVRHPMNASKSSFAGKKVSWKYVEKF